MRSTSTSPTTGRTPPFWRWQLVLSDEFDGAAGKAPNANVWGNEVGDGTAYGITGWGNDQLEYYTPGGANAAADGNGNLVITTKTADGSLQRYYGRAIHLRRC